MLVFILEKSYRVTTTVQPPSNNKNKKKKKMTKTKMKALHSTLSFTSTVVFPKRAPTSYTWPGPRNNFCEHCKLIYYKQLPQYKTKCNNAPYSPVCCYFAK